MTFVKTVNGKGHIFVFLFDSLDSMLFIVVCVTDFL